MTIFENLRSEIKVSIVSATSAGILSGVLATLGSMWVLVVTLPGKIGLTPSNAIMAFDLNTGCPAGWDKFVEARGRFIIGSASKSEIDEVPNAFAQDDRNLSLTPKPFRVAGGEESHRLTPAEMPAHSHLTVLGSEPRPDLAFYGAGPPNLLAIAGAGRGNHALTYTSVSGENAYHNNMPPYIPLLYCKKI